MNKKISVSVALTITLIAITVTFAVTWIVSSESFNQAVSSVTQRQAQYSKLAEIDNYTRHNYYGEIDDTALGDSIARGYVAGIGDRWATYYSEPEYTELRAYESGNHVGIGVELVRDADSYFRIVRVYEDSPAAKAGVQVGGRITYVDDVDAKTVSSIRRMYSLLRGEEGTLLKLTCLYGVADEQVIEVQRSAFTAPTVEYVKAGAVGYLRIYGFEANTATDFDFQLGRALNDDVKALVFDVRNNAGNQLQGAYSVIDRLCPRGTVAKSLAKNGTIRVLATSDDEAVDLPMVVLVDANTGSAAELFATSVRTLAGGQIAGVTTQGKWLIQSAPQPLTDGSAVSITTAMLLTGEDESYEGVGVVPDVEILSTSEDESRLYTVADLRNDQQVMRALELARNMTGDNSLDFQPEVLLPVTSSASAPESGSDASASASASISITNSGGEIVGASGYGNYGDASLEGAVGVDDPEPESEAESGADASASSASSSGGAASSNAAASASGSDG